MFKILANRMIVPNLHETVIEAPEIAAKARPGQFVILRVEDDGERIPLTIADWNQNTGAITVIFSNVGKTTQKLAAAPAGTLIPTAVGPLGNPMAIDLYGQVLLVGGCYGIASIYPIARALKEKGNGVTILVEARSGYLLYWEQKLRSVSDRFLIITRDGSRGLRGHIGLLGKVIAGLPAVPDRVIVNGCNYLMMRGSEESRPLNIKTMVSLNTLMMDGTGMCGVCRVTVKSSTKFACVDGPHFDGHEVNWDELARRRKAYLAEEALAYQSSAAEI